MRMSHSIEGINVGLVEFPREPTDRPASGASVARRVVTAIALALATTARTGESALAIVNPFRR